MDDTDCVVIRSYRIGDEALIYSTWRNALAFGSYLKKHDSKKVFKDLTKHIREILNKVNTNMKIACLESDSDQIIGYSVFTGKHLEFVYVKEGYRREGIGTLLVPKNIETYAELRTNVGDSIYQKKFAIKEKTNEEETRPAHPGRKRRTRSASKQSPGPSEIGDPARESDLS